MTPEQKRRFADDVIAGLSAPQPDIPCKYLYDERGSKLFEAICETDDYYVTRADIALHEAHVDEIEAAIGPDAHIIEFGSGAGIKIRIILGSADHVRAYTAIEISRQALAQAAAELRRDFPELEIHSLAADYTHDIDTELFRLDPPARRRVIYFPGSTISNFTHEDAHAFLGRMARMAGTGGGVLIGVDRVKSRERLIRAYDDSEGVTAEFNRNLLRRLKTELGAEIDEDAFAHRARYVEALERIEMHLEAVRDTAITVDGQRFEFAAGDTIHTENSHKYSVESFKALLPGTGLELNTTWTDPEELFSMHYLEVV
ncbi:MAG: L-histidine N(alpha)-methyltransferase [Wenzhouxiangellaceae bacterium]|nr:L-histidine N(alpha)-methyltransferase [Wenzhouxiangellaceae bacterium]